MAGLRLQPPEPFNFKKPDEWLKWSKRFEQFRVASGLSSEGEIRQVSTLLYCLGEEAEDVLQSTNITEDERKTYADVHAKLDAYFQVRKNVIFERARFNRRNQQEGETADEYIAALYNLAENCNYAGLKGEMIRDRLVVGIRDSALSERLQLDANLTLEKAKTSVRQKEAVHEQQGILKGDSRGNPITLDAVKSTPKTPFKKRGPENELTKPARPVQKQCSRCGRGHHRRDKCPAKDATCHKCQRKGHYSAQCFSKTMSTVTTEDTLEDTYLDCVTSDQPSAWSAMIKVGARLTTFKLDTGAEVTAVSEEFFQTLDKTLHKPSRLLYGPSRHSLDVIGQFNEVLHYKDRSAQQTIYVVRGLKTNLLGLPAIISLNLATRIDTTTVADYKSLVEDSFPTVFRGLGNLGDPHIIKLAPGAKPHAIYTPRSIALPMRSKAQEELDRMESMGVISRVEEPTQWCAGMVAIPKKNGTLRICVDLKHLNEAVLREVHPLPKVDETLAQLSGAAIFSKLDANSGFWQIPLSEESRPLTTFISPSGRYWFNKLPFGISSAPEHFQRRMSTMLRGLEGVVCQMDDVLVFGHTAEEHDVRLKAVLKRIEEAGATLNPEKCSFGQTRVKFLGHVIDKDGISADPDKVDAIHLMGAPNNLTELRRFLGMVNHLGKFSPNLAKLAQPLHQLLSKHRQWEWGTNQESAFLAVKQELTSSTVLRLYDPNADAKISADASSYGLGAVLLQRNDGTDSWKPVAFASRTLTQAECHYAQIEKEALATTWACEKFANYILGKRITIETDHKPLVPLFSTKNLDQMPPRVLRFRLRLNRFDFSIHHTPGKELYLADALSRAPTAPPGDNSVAFTSEIEAFVETITAALPASSDRLQQYRNAQSSDAVCSMLQTYCNKGWPGKHHLPSNIKPYWRYRGELTIVNNLLLYNHRIVVPVVLQAETLTKIHQGHQGIQRCRARARNAVWWPQLSNHIEHLVQSCPECVEHSTSPREPMIPSTLPDYPWQRVSSDLFYFKGATYLLIVDYYSRYPEIVKLNSTTSGSVIKALRSIFSRHGIPEVFISDNGPQYASGAMKEFAKSYGFDHITSSPHYPQGNGLAERTVKTVKNLFKKSGDPYLALMTYRATPFPWCGRSPGELLMGRQLRTDLPQTKIHLVPQWPYLKTFQQQEKQFKVQQEVHYNKRHRTQPLPSIPNDEQVWVKTKTQQEQGTVIKPADTPRSYIVESGSGQVRRNRQHLTVMPDEDDTKLDQEPNSSGPRASPIMTRSRTGTPINPPDRL